MVARPRRRACCTHLPLRYSLTLRGDAAPLQGDRLIMERPTRLGTSYMNISHVWPSTDLSDASSDASSRASRSAVRRCDALTSRQSSRDLFRDPVPHACTFQDKPKWRHTRQASEVRALPPFNFRCRACGRVSARLNCLVCADRLSGVGVVVSLVFHSIAQSVHAL